MKNIGLLLVFSLLIATGAWGQSVQPLQTNVVAEGNTAFLPVVFYDENNRSVVPEKVWFNIYATNSNTLMQSTRALVTGGTGDTPYFSPNTDTFPSMTLIGWPCANRVENDGAGEGEANTVNVWFLYPSTCTPSATTTPCKQGSGTFTYVKRDQKNLYTGKGSTACGAGGWGATHGCLYPANVVATACDGTE